MSEVVARQAKEVLRGVYSDEEVDHLYEFGRFLAESGDYRRAEVIFQGLTVVAPRYAPAWLGLALVQIVNQAFDQAATSARSALQADATSVEATLFLIAALLSLGDWNAAGTLLGEIGEKIESGEIDNSYVVRFFKSQLARFECRKV